MIKNKKQVLNSFNLEVGMCAPTRISKGYYSHIRAGDRRNFDDFFLFITFFMYRFRNNGAR